jgi:peptide/nickel transport system ATP-binding protein
MDAREQRDLTFLFITHDLAVVEHFGSRVAVMYLGTLCELAPTGKLFSVPRHPYTQALLSAIPKLNQDSSDYIKLKGEVPTPVNLPSGCVFHSRCVHTNERCTREVPEIKVYDDTSIACHAVEEGRI